MVVGINNILRTTRGLCPRWLNLFQGVRPVSLFFVPNITCAVLLGGQRWCVARACSVNWFVGACFSTMKKSCSDLGFFLFYQCWW